MPERNLLVLDTNKWLKLIGEIAESGLAEKWKGYLEEYDFDVVLPDLVLQELVDLLTESKAGWVYENRKRIVLRLIQSGKVFGIDYVRASREDSYYSNLAVLLMKKYGIRKILKENGLCRVQDHNVDYALHAKDLGILLSLRKIVKSYYFITHDEGLFKALKIKGIRDILIKEGIHFILIYETQKAKNRRVTRIKVLPGSF